MLSTISWSQYLLFISAITAVYYLVLAATFYRKELLQRFSRRPYRPQYRADLAIPVANGVMGSVLFEDDDEPLRGPGGYGNTDKDDPSAATDREEQKNEEEADDDDYDDYDDEASQVADWDIMEDLVNRISGVIDKSPGSITPDELVEALSMTVGKGDKEVLSKFHDSIAQLVIDRVSEKLGFQLTDKALRPLWL